MIPVNKVQPVTSPPAVSRMLNYAEQNGRTANNLVSLVRGEPDFRTPDHICQALFQAIDAGYTHYPVVNGYPKLRQAVADRLTADYGLAFDPEDEILITSGGTAGMYIALRTIISPGDEVLVPDPIYDPYPNQVRVVGGVPVMVKAERRGDHFTLTAEALKAALTSRTKAIILNTPWNPTGSVLSENELLEIGTFAVAHGLIIIIDEIYEKLVYGDSRHHSLVGLSPDFRNHVITVNSFSKTYAMTGWRLGYNLANPAFTKTMMMYYQHFSRGSASFVQQAGIRALNGPQDCVSAMVAAYTERRALLAKLIGQISDVSCLIPEGSLFCLVDARQFEMSSEALAQYLVRDWGLLTVPGAYYGPSLEGYLRLSFSYAGEDIQRGIDLLADGLKAL